MPWRGAALHLAATARSDARPIQRRSECAPRGRGAEQFLDGADVVAGLQQVGGERGAQDVRGQSPSSFSRASSVLR